MNKRKWNSYDLLDSADYGYLVQGNLRGNSTPNQKLACFALHLKIVNTFLKKKK